MQRRKSSKQHGGQQRTRNSNSFEEKTRRIRRPPTPEFAGQKDQDFELQQEIPKSSFNNSYQK